MCGINNFVAGSKIQLRDASKIALNRIVENNKLAINIINIAYASKYEELKYCNIYIPIKDVNKYQSIFDTDIDMLGYDFSQAYSEYEVIRFKFSDNKYYIIFLTVTEEHRYEEDEDIDEDNLEDATDDDAFRIEITYDSFKMLLTTILYDNNYKDIKDNYEVSFLPNNLQEDDNVHLVTLTS